MPHLHEMFTLLHRKDYTLLINPLARLVRPLLELIRIVARAVDFLLKILFDLQLYLLLQLNAR